MNIQRLMLLKYKPRYLTHKVLFGTHTETCPEYMKQFDKPKNGALKRAEKSGKVRLGFIPEEFFVFFYPKTGITGPYLFGIMALNYLVSKEIYVMEHEYYIGLSVLVIACYSTKKFGSLVAASLDKEVEKVEASYNLGRKEEESNYETVIKNAKTAQWRANGQKMLIDAKKENVAMQLEACYRERLMHVYNSVKRRLEYHAKLTRIETNIHQKWMCAWILDNVLKSITPEIENKIIVKAIEDLAKLSAHSGNKQIRFS
ncbi:ATP synthase subunit b, mitochondrial [Papilio machaon]|uniref:ATP synthase subunit b n=1 Tax=Papilio machaon TaxID=76193 RepID=A0A194R036_PAPMA|nr:ATP synthase subunit b, mitochondrial [Papilio machaon]KPJ09211.1 ATP synthase subunit b, mitochondrial [Papilio machaon]